MIGKLSSGSLRIGFAFRALSAARGSRDGNSDETSTANHKLKEKYFKSMIPSFGCSDIPETVAFRARNAARGSP